jgi:hypothetical protein
MGIKPSFDPEKTQWVMKTKFGINVDEVFTIGMPKKARATIQWKAQRAIVNEACKQTLIKKVNGQKPFFVT